MARLVFCGLEREVKGIGCESTTKTVGIWSRGFLRTRINIILYHTLEIPLRVFFVLPWKGNLSLEICHKGNPSLVILTSRVHKL